MQRNFRKMFSKNNVPRGWALDLSLSKDDEIDRSVCSLIKFLDRPNPDFEYVLKPHQRPSLAFGSKIPRDPNEKEIKRHKFKLRKKRAYGETYQREIRKPQLLRLSRSKSKSKDRSQSKALEESEEAFEDDSDEESEEPFAFEEDDDEYDEYCDDDAFDDDEEEHEISTPISTEEDDSRIFATRLSSDKIEQFKLKKQFGSRTPKIENLLPSPVSYMIRRFPDDNTCHYKAHRNKAPFNSTSAQEIKKITDVPSPAAYKVDAGDEIKGIKMNSSLGGKQSIVLPTVIRCTPRNRLICKKCQKIPFGDSYYSKYHGMLCRECFPIEMKSLSPHIVETFKKARHCNFMHYHAQHNTIRHKKEKDIIRSVRREAYLDQFPVLMKTPKIVKKIQSTPLTKGDFHKRILKALKPFEKPKDCGKICKQADSGDKLSNKFKREKKSHEDEPKQRKESADWEFIMLAKEVAYGLAKRRSSIAPIYHLLNPEDKENLFQLEYGKTETTDFQKKLLKRFGSPAPYYGTLINEYREKGVVHAIDPESDTYTLTAKGREFYKNTPLAWELSQEMDEDDHYDDKVDLDEMIKKKITKGTKQKQRDVKTPPLPGPRLSLIATSDTIKPPKPRLSKIFYEKPIISRDYDIPQSYWYNIEY